MPSKKTAKGLKPQFAHILMGSAEFFLCVTFTFDVFGKAQQYPSSSCDIARLCNAEEEKEKKKQP